MERKQLTLSYGNFTEGKRNVWRNLYASEMKVENIIIIVRACITRAGIHSRIYYFIYTAFCFSFFFLLSLLRDFEHECRVTGKRRIFEEVRGAKTPSRTRYDDFGVALAVGRGNRTERSGARPVRGGAVARFMDQ